MAASRRDRSTAASIHRSCGRNSRASSRAQGWQAGNCGEPAKIAPALERFDFLLEPDLGSGLISVAAREDAVVPPSLEPCYSAAETARRLGVSVRALRVYERHGLVRPNRTAAGWRVYGPEEISRLHQVIALKRVGLKLAQIAKLVRDNTVPIHQLLCFPEEEVLHL